ncbi:MAG TPA: hypothetical protein ENF73_01510 [Proteobacteria bacterium]|nr:hypothetical protein [Pseudomonadota bacterium]
MMVYFGDLNWRSAGTVGLESIHLFENDTGPDDANHDYEGIFIIRSPHIPETQRGRKLEGVSIYDITPTLLKITGVAADEPFVGRCVI